MMAAEEDGRYAHRGGGGNIAAQQVARNRDEMVAPGRQGRNHAFCACLLIFVLIRVWLLAVDSGSVFYLLFTSISTLCFVVMCVTFQYRRCRMQREYMRQLEEGNFGLGMNEFAQQQNGVGGAAGGGGGRGIYADALTKEQIASLPRIVFGDEKKKGDVETGCEEDIVCSICLEGFQQSDLILVLPACRHMYHELCVSSWLGLSASCPLCKHLVNAPSAAAAAAADGNHAPQQQQQGQVVEAEVLS